MTRTGRWPIVLGCAAVLALAVTTAYARGGGGRKGGKAKGGAGSAQARLDYLEVLQQEDADEASAGFLDDATREPLHLIRAVDRGE